MDYSCCQNSEMKGLDDSTLGDRGLRRSHRQNRGLGLGDRRTRTEILKSKRDIRLERLLCICTFCLLLQENVSHKVPFLARNQGAEWLKVSRQGEDRVRGIEFTERLTRHMSEPQFYLIPLIKQSMSNRLCRLRNLRLNEHYSPTSW